MQVPASIMKNKRSSKGKRDDVSQMQRLKSEPMEKLDSPRESEALV